MSGIAHEAKPHFIHGPFFAHVESIEKKHLASNPFNLPLWIKKTSKQREEDPTISEVREYAGIGPPKF